MCVIVHKKPGVILRKKILQECWSKNSDGAGLMWSENGKLNTVKGLMTFQELWDFLIRDEFDGKNKDLLIHFRMCTAGETTPELCHPFHIDKDLAFMHNGVLMEEAVIDPYDKKSDTLLLCNKILKQLPRNFLNNRGLLILLNAYLGNSTLVFMDAKGKITKVGDLNGDMETQGYWFSNYYWSTKLLQRTINKLQRGIYVAPKPEDYDSYSKEIEDNEVAFIMGKTKTPNVKNAREIPIFIDNGV